MSKTLSNLLLDLYTDLGQNETPFSATTGSTTTIRNTNFSLLESPPAEDYANLWTAFVSRDAAGAGAAPEGQFKMITAYDEVAFEYTTEAFTLAVGVGDLIVIVNNEFPLNTMIELANSVMTDQGRLELIDDSITTVTGQSEYTLPLGIVKENLYDVRVQTHDDAGDNDYVSIPFEVVPAAAGTAHTLIVHQVTGLLLRLYYRDFHARLTAYNSVISPTLQYSHIKAALRYKAIDWYNQNNETEDGFWLDAERKAAGLYDVAKVEFPQRPPQIENKGLYLNKYGDFH